jgi:hypothetical protein
MIPNGSAVQAARPRTSQTVAAMSSDDSASDVAAAENHRCPVNLARRKWHTFGYGAPGVPGVTEVLDESRFSIVIAKTPFLA